MKYFLMIALSVLMTGSAAEAHNRDRHRHYPRFQHGPGHVIYTPWGVVSSVPNRIRITEHCVYKPWKNKTICRF